MRKHAAFVSGLLVTALLCAGPAFGSGDGDEAQLIGTTVKGHPATRGQVDVTTPGVLTFHSSTGGTDLVMPYDKVFEFGISEEDAFHLGFFPAMFYGMVAPRPRKHTFTVSWHGTDGEAQVATFEISKSLNSHLVPVMYARARSACVRKEFTHEYSTCTPVVPPPTPPRIPLTPQPLPVPAPGPPAPSQPASAPTP